ncbi:MAG TPA: phosphate ABC transporter ATP-binding protein [Acidimicrobiales bacterium]|nr:phosphate ABC transporter ATP-binding protein [Acidimicrobiales bacterium]
MAVGDGPHDEGAGDQGATSGVTTLGANPRRSPAYADPRPERAPASRAAVGLLTRPVIEARDVAVGFGSKQVLSGVDLAIAPDTINALIGPTGCGKSTLLRSFNRMNDKVRGYWRTGAIDLDGTEITSDDMDPLVLRRRVGMVFQRPNPFPLCIRDNVLAGVRAHGLVHRREYAETAERYLREVGLWPAVADRLTESPFRLSGGQQQLLCLARALAVEPDVLLLDEPTSSLDPITTEMVEDLLRKLAARLTIVIVTHNLAQARRVADTTAFLYNGRLVEAGDTEKIFDNPAEPETVSYVSGRIG